MEDRELDKRIRKVLCEEWEKVQPRILHSETIHERLAAEGVDIPGGVLVDTLVDLRDSGFITLAPGGRESFHRRDNNLTITDVGPDLIDMVLG